MRTGASGRRRRRLSGSSETAGPLDLLAAALTDPAWWVRRNAATALALIPGGTARLFEALAGADRFSADAAAEALLDSGELAAARMRQHDGVAQPRDLVLIGHMESGR